MDKNIGWQDWTNAVESLNHLISQTGTKVTNPFNALFIGAMIICSKIVDLNFDEEVDNQ